MLCCSLPCATNDFTNAAHSLQRLEVTCWYGWICCRQHSLVTFSIPRSWPFFSHHLLVWKLKKCESRHAPHHVSRFKSASQSQFGSTEPWKEQISVSGNSFSDTRELWTGKRESFEFFSIRWMAVSFANCCVCSVVCCIRLFSRKATHELTNLTWTSSLRSKRCHRTLEPRYWSEQSQKRPMHFWGRLWGATEKPAAWRGSTSESCLGAH